MNIFESIADFFDHPIFIIVGGITVVFAVMGIIYRLSCIALGVSPLVFRIGKAVWRRKVAIIGGKDAFDALQECIIDTDIFKKQNVKHIQLTNIEKVKVHTLLIIDWESCIDHIDEIFTNRKDHNTAVIIFAQPASIPPDMMIEYANKANTVVVNFKGRLLNDILNSLITTSF